MSLFKKKRKPQKLKYVEKIYNRYGDFTEVGVWGTSEVDQDGNFTGTGAVSGKMYTETIKVQYDNGELGLESEWIADTDPRVIEFNKNQTDNT